MLGQRAIDLIEALARLRVAGMSRERNIGSLVLQLDAVLDEPRALCFRLRDDAQRRGIIRYKSHID